MILTSLCYFDLDFGHNLPRLRCSVYTGCAQCGSDIAEDFKQSRTDDASQHAAVPQRLLGGAPRDSRPALGEQGDRGNGS